MRQLLATIGAHHTAWQAWFDRHAVRPLAVTYEELVDDPRATVLRIAAHVGAAVPKQWRPDSPHRRQADGTNAHWAAALRRAVQA